MYTGLKDPVQRKKKENTARKVLGHPLSLVLLSNVTLGAERRSGI